MLGSIDYQILHVGVPDPTQSRSGADAASHRGAARIQFRDKILVRGAASHASMARTQRSSPVNSLIDKTSTCSFARSKRPQ